MPFFAGLAQRQLEPEVIDQPDLEEERRVRALRGLERINRWSRSVHILWPSIAAYAAEKKLKSLSLLDIATGAGDVPIGLWHKARHAGLSLRIEAWDISSQAIAYARAKAAMEKAEILFFRRDILNGPILLGYDIIISSLFLHHLNEEQAGTLLRYMSQAAQGMILVNDLVRCPAGLALAYAGSRLLSASDVVHSDAPSSVRAAFTIEEALALAQATGLAQACVSPRWPKRFLLEWRRP